MNKELQYLVYNTPEGAGDFYSMIQNKFHYAITGKMAAEI